MLRSPLPRPLRSRFAAPLAGVAVLIAGAAPVAPVQAQSIGTVTKPGLPDPWHGVILITPLDEDSPYEAAQRAAEAGEAEGAAPAPAEASMATDAPLEPFDPEKATATMPSLWETIELGLGGAPEEPAPEPPKPYQQIQPRTAPVERARATLPTRMELRQGAAMVSISSSASATAPASGALSTTATSGSGEIKGRVGLEQDHLTVYSAGAVGASASPGSATVYDSMAVGSTYSVPLAPLGLGPEKLGASVEVDKSQSVTTGVELRAPVGSAERFISVQRSQSPGSEASGIVKAGVLGKF
ncbi:hypothetical protein [Ancylobacter rudongensis]|uniref:Uncharacterized protein n=1 Tax=Ancylobacter rudongensis TaxID=177413 RepID=A0A1G4PKA3_9HYPH|nr:hypothetical protein [Ancylobacter rudongensis]SCW32692.1 hypothetical protein SAMN05660859_0612 [Ancylobacter rudongensis]